MDQAFNQQMQRLLPQEWEAFAYAMRAPATRGVRLHRLGHEPHINDSILAIRSTLPIMTAVKRQLGNPIPWVDDGYYLSSDSPLGQSVHHQAGAFYIQEPSAMAVVSALAPKPGERILDLCAAPGGKTTSIGCQMAGEGLLVANEIHPQRVVILAENLERLGVPAVVVNETPQRLAKAWPCEFDALLVDAPCSGEGMFRKNPEAQDEWTSEAPILCAARQKEILTAADELLRPGGRLIYSTCTFNPMENEQIVAWMMDTLGYHLAPLPLWSGWQPGVPTWADGREDLRHTRRLWPHIGQGEGHFVACLYKPETEVGQMENRQILSSPRTTVDKLWTSFIEGLVANALPPSIIKPCVQADRYYSDEIGKLPVAKLRILRPGIPLGNVDKKRFIPHHALSMSLSTTALANGVERAIDEATAIRYLRGETIPADEWTGIRLVSVERLPLGFGKGLTDRVNNLYPKGLRRHDLFNLPAN